jgi:uncharacterized membrane protein
MNTPASWVMALTYWLHLLATVVWIGSLAAVNLLVLPSLQSLEAATQARFISALQKRLEPLAWFCMGILLATGMFQMSANAHYNGFLDASAQWSLSILIKHILGVLMVAVSALQTWDVIPALQRALMKKENADSAELVRLQKRERMLLRVNLFLSAFILAATAFARAA